MRTFLISTALMGLVASAFASEAATPAPEASAAASAAVQAAAAHAEPRLICHRETPIGSTIPQKVCHREEDVAQTAQVQQQLANEAQRNRMITVHAGGN